MFGYIRVVYFVSTIAKTVRARTHYMGRIKASTLTTIIMLAATVRRPVALRQAPKMFAAWVLPPDSGV